MRTARSLTFALVLAAGCRSGIATVPSPPAPERGAGDDGAALLLAAWDLDRQGRPDAALDALARLEASGWEIPILPEDFPGASGREAFRAIAARVAARAPRTEAAPLAFTIPERGLVAEGVAADPRTGALLVGSIHRRKIVRVARDGTITDLVPAGAGGLERVLGLEVDAARGLLWAAANERGPGVAEPRSGLHAFDLATGAPRRSVSIAGPGHLLNDVAAAEDGTVFVTDSEAGQVLRLDPGAPALVPLVPPGRFLYANGIVIVDGHLLVADARALWEVPRDGGAPRRLRGPPGFPLGGLDGIDADGRTLVAVQNGLGAPRIVRLVLAPGAASVVNAAVLEAGNPGWHLPTTGALTGGAFVYVGNSHVDAWRDGALDPAGDVETRLYRLPVR